MLKTRGRKQPVFVYGASGHAKVVIDALERQGRYAVAFLVDDDANFKKQTIYGYRLIGTRDDLLTAAKRKHVKAGIVAIGSNSARRAVVHWLMEVGFDFITVVHPSATIGRGVTVGVGSVIMPGAVVNSDSSIREHVIINTGATVDHDCTIGPFAHIAPGAHLCGSVTVGTSSFLCAGVTVIPGRVIGDNVVVGAGSTVIEDVPDDVAAAGSPARMVKRRERS